MAADCDRAARVAWWHGSRWAHGSLKIILSGRSSGKLCSRVLVTGLLVLVCARVPAGQHADLQGRNAAVEMVRRRSTVRFRKGAPGHGLFFEQETAYLAVGGWHLSGIRTVGNARASRFLAPDEVA